MSLTSSELKQFNELGYVVKPGVFAAADMQPIKDAICEIVDREARRLHAAGELDEIFADEPFETRLARIWRHDRDAGLAVYHGILGKGGGGFSGPAMYHVLMHEPLLACIESLVGPEIVSSSVYRIRPKIPGFVHGEVPWHQDSGYTLAHCDNSLVVTCWVPLVDATVDNGCLYVVPERHRQGVYRHYTGGHGGFLEIPTGVAADELPAADAVPVEMAAGGVLLMTNLTPHASFENKTDIVRWSLDLRYQNADVPNNVGEAPEDYTPERDPVTMACFPHEADFVVRSRSHPEREVKSAEEFHRLRKRFEEGRSYSPGRGWTALAERGA